MEERIDRLVDLAERQHATIVEQGQQIATLTEHVGLLAQSVALLLGEETGVALEDREASAEPQRTDMDGNPY